MKSKNICLLLVILVFSCKPKMDTIQTSRVKTASSEVLLEDKISIRAIFVDKNEVWYAADKNRFGVYDLNTKKREERKIIQDTLQLEFRSAAQTSEAVFVLSVANPALLYKINKKDLTHKLVYQEKNEKVFYDSMQFWNDQEGIAIGDPTEACFSLLITRDGGNSWKKIACENLPKLAEGEAFFAASNTNIIIKGSKTFVVSGGKKSRIFVSEDKGLTWTVYNTPIVQGQSMTGIFSADFYNEKLGYAVGGNYEKPLDDAANKAITVNGGKTWELKGINEAFGYASCVQFVPGKKGKEIVTVGTSGVFYSDDMGTTWRKILEDKDLHIIQFQNEHTAFAAGRNKIIRINFK